MSTIQINGYSVIFDDGAEYMQYGGKLFHVRDRTAEADYDIMEQFEIRKHLGAPATNVKHITLYQRERESHKDRRNKRLQTKLLSGYSKMLEENQGVFSKVLDLMADRHVEFKDRYEDAILGAFKFLGAESTPVTFNMVYPLVCRALGADEESAENGIAPDPYNPGSLKDIRGLIRSWVEERCPHSRQHYFRGGVRARWLPGQRSMLFVNYGLAHANEAVAWAPYQFVRGDGWMLDPETATAYQKPSDEGLDAAAAQYKKRGMQGCRNATSSVTDVTKYRREMNVAGTATMAVTGFMGAAMGYFAAAVYTAPPVVY